MKNLLLVGLLCTIVWQIQGQDWHPFPLQQRSYWAYGDEIKLYYNDFRDQLDTEATQLLFGKEYYLGESEQPCFDFIAGEFFQAPDPAKRVDTLIQHLAEVYPAQEPERIFRPWAVPGESWTVVNESNPGSIDSIVWTCYNSNMATVFGETVEVKNFLATRYQAGNILDEIPVTLSKNRGLINWLPFDHWFRLDPVVMELKGWKKDEQSAGFINQFESYFEGIQAGDVFKYEVSQGGSGYVCNRADLFERDSVMSIISTDSAITIQYYRKYQKWCYYYDEFGAGYYLYSTSDGDTVVSRTYALADFINDLEATPDWFYYTDANYGFENLVTRHADTIRIATNDRITFAASNMDPIEWSTCQFGWVDICYDWYQLMEGVGIFWESRSCLTSGFNRRLIGYRQDEEEWGDISQLVVSAKEQATAVTMLKAFPNPNDGHFQVEIPRELQRQSAVLALFDISGRVVYQEILGVLPEIHSIAVDHLPSGVYTLKLNGHGVHAVSRVVVR